MGRRTQLTKVFHRAAFLYRKSAVQNHFFCILFAYLLYLVQAQVSAVTDPAAGFPRHALPKPLLPRALSAAAAWMISVVDGREGIAAMQVPSATPVPAPS